MWSGKRRIVAVGSWSCLTRPEEPHPSLYSPSPLRGRAIVGGGAPKTVSHRYHPTEWLWRECLSIRSQFCEAVVKAGYLTWEQMVSAACRYRLGVTRQGGVIFWQIDHEERVRDGKVMYYGPDCHRLKDKAHHPTWVSAFLRQRDPFPNAPHETSHCFFGTHLLTTNYTNYTNFGNAIISSDITINSFNSLNSLSLKTICVVEAEKTAFVMSELYPEYVWLATGGLGEVQTEKFRPLRGHKVILFPDTDPDGIAFRRWSEAATLVMQQPFWEDSPPIRVSPLLETHTTPEQKQAKIDLIDFLF